MNRFALRAFFTLALAAALFTTGSAQPPATTTTTSAQPQKPVAPSFTSGVDVVSLNVTVTDGTLRYVTDIEEADFNVFEDGVKQELTYFNRTNLPIAMSLLLDTSEPSCMAIASGTTLTMLPAGTSANPCTRSTDSNTS